MPEEPSSQSGVGYEHPTVVVRRRADRRFRAGHPWIFKGDVTDVHAAGGDVVRVVGEDGHPRGWALYSDASLIALRMLTRQDEPVGAELWRRRLQDAVAYRRELGIDSTAYRLVNAEADLLPSLIVDRYDEWLVVQALSQSMQRLLPDVVGWLSEILAAGDVAGGAGRPTGSATEGATGSITGGKTGGATGGPVGILARHDVGVRRLEGLDREVEVLAGEVPESVVVTENGTRFEVDLRGGQKTGLFLDQRENHAAAASYARGRALDGFCYAGGFALAMAGSCDRVTAVDASEDAAALLRRNAELNGIDNVDAVVGNVFDLLRGFAEGGDSFDTIVLDPPAFAKNKASVPGALRGYKEINLRALKILSPGGHLITCSCSYHIGEDTFLDLLNDAATDVGARVQIVEVRRQARDHPVLLGVPETHYLKCVILRKL